MTNKSKARHGMSRSYRFKLNPTTRAIRNAFALGLALAAGSGPALAACVVDDNYVECDGALTGVNYSIDDLTLVAGSNLLTVIVPGDGIDGIYADGGIGSVSVTSDATIVTNGAWGIEAVADETVTVVTTGNIISVDYGAIGAFGGGDVSVTNSGLITSASVSGTDYALTGITASSKYGDTTVSNELGASIDVVSAYGEYASATGVLAISWKYDASVTNAGDISALTVGGDANGIVVASFDGDASATNADTGTISAVVDSDLVPYYTGYTSGSAVGMVVGSVDGNASATNAGSITASVDAKYGGDATGVIVSSTYGDASFDNTGSVVASTYGKYAGNATGASVYAGGAASLHNGIDGTISGEASTKYADAYGAVVVGGDSSSITNEGSIAAVATSTNSDSYYTGSATATGATVGYGSASSLINTGEILAHARAYTGNASALGAGVFGYDAYTYNNGNSIHAYAETDYGDATATGSLTSGTYAELNNLGSITASAIVNVAGAASATGSSVQGYDASTSNSGSIFASASSDYGSAVTLGSVTSGYYASLENSGEITSHAIVGTGYANAVASLVVGYFASTYNSEYGSLEAAAEADFGNATTYGALTTGIDASLDNDGSILAGAYVFEEGDAIAFGALTTGYTANTYNSGSITAIADTNIGAAHANGVLNSGDYSYVSNEQYGTIHANALVQDGNAYATGIYAVGEQLNLVSNDGHVYAEALAVSGDATAFGAHLYNNSSGGVSELFNYGSIAAQATADGGAYANATGARLVADSALIYNEGGSIAATASAYGGTAIAIGADAYGKYSASYNTGSITAEATADYGVSSATGVQSYGILEASVINEGGSITATASSYHGLAFATGVNNESLVYDAYVSNTGTIEASALADYGQAFSNGVSNYSNLGDSLVSNSGGISGYTYTYGGEAFASGATSGSYLGDATVYNSDTGSISGSAYAYGGEATAFGATARSTKYTAHIVNYGDISAAATGSYLADAVGATVSSEYSYAYLTNDGSITATATSDDVAIAVGALVESHYTAYATNTGSIAATATGYVGYAIGLSAESEVGDVVIENGSGGSITATGHGDYVSAIAVDMDSGEFNYLFNSGSITAASDHKYSIAVNSNDGAVAEIYNYGTITGSIQTGNYGDYLYNDGVWNTRQTSYFGAGDDYIYNTGTIVMDSTTIDLGSFGEAGNYFNNEGTIVVRGHSYIDMGENAVDNEEEGVDYFANPLPFANNGVLDFLDGATDDTLTIIGDFTGQGSLSLDFSGLNQTADILYVEGDIIEPTSQVVNGVLRSPPTAVSTEIPFAYIDGTSVSTDFVLGTIATPTDLFYTLDFSVISDIDASNATPDVFSLGLDVSGLSPRGVLASSIAPGVQNLWHSSIGTVFQREGTVRDQEEMGVAPWVRVFSNSGDVTPLTEISFGAGGDQTFEQKNSGVEVGVAFNFNQAFSAGLLFGKSKADLKPEAGGKAEIDADVYGIYATWTPGTGFYLDGAYRRMNFDTDATVVGGNFESNGSADGFSVETGYAFTTASGLKIEPQFQYSSMSIDDLDIVTSSWGNFVISDADSARMRLGVALRKTFASSDDYSWTPYVSVNAVREDDGDNAYSIGGSTFNGSNSLGGTSTLVELGATGQMGAWTVFGGLNWQDGDAYDSVVGGQLGVRYAFGRAAPVAAPAPMVVAAPTKTCADLDDDGDGVNNCDDKCPGSEAGQAIGADGCPVPAAQPEPVMEPKPFRG